MNFRERRLNAKPFIRLREVAFIARLDPSTVHLIETGKTKKPSYEAYMAIDAALTRLETERAAADKNNPEPEAA